MQLSLEQVTQLAPDSQSVAAGKKLLALKFWSEVGFNETALWGMCRGSRTYQVKVDFANMGYACNCPSRKFPCKHVLGLLMLMATSADAIADGSSPLWVSEWIDKRREKAAKNEEKASAPAKPVNVEAQKKTADKRKSNVAAGLEQLSVWLDDTIRNGLATLESKPFSYFDEQAKRLVDSQAPTLAGRIRRLADIPQSSRQWPEQMLAELGRIKLLIYAFERIDSFAEPLQADIRQMIGWNVKTSELVETGEAIEDEWLIHSQQIDDDDHLRSQRSWAVGLKSERTAMVLQFAPGAQPFEATITPGTVQSGTLTFYPSAVPMRARFTAHADNIRSISDELPGFEDCESFLNYQSELLSILPWLGTIGAIFRNVSLVKHGDNLFLRDHTGAALPVQSNSVWHALAMTGGHPCHLAGEWNGHHFHPMGVAIDGAFRVLP